MGFTPGIQARFRLAYAALGCCALGAVGAATWLAYPQRGGDRFPPPLARAVARLEAEPRVVVWFSDQAGTQVTTIDRSRRTIEVLDPGHDEVVPPWSNGAVFVHRLLGDCESQPVDARGFHRLARAVLIGAPDVATAFLVLSDGVVGDGATVSGLSTTRDGGGRAVLTWAALPGVLARRLHLAVGVRRAELRLDAAGRPSLLTLSGSGPVAIATFDYPTAVAAPSPPHCAVPPNLD